MPIADMAWYMRRRYQANRLWAIEQLGGKCVHCGATDKLEFDHLDRSEKEDTVANLLRGRGRKALAKELARCQLLCKKCHKRKHEPPHGTRSRYTNRGCRCDDCRNASNKYNREWKQQRRSSSMRRASGS